MSVKRTHRIRKLRLSEISFVDEGDNPGAEVLITKRRPVSVEIIKGQLAEAMEAAGELAELETGFHGEEGVEKAATILGGMNMNIEELQARLDEIETNLANVEKAKDDAEARAKKAEDDLAAATAEIEKLKGSDKGDAGEDDVLKSLPASVRERLEKAEQAAATATQEIEKAKDARELDVQIAKVRELGVKDADSVGALLHRIAKGKSVPEDADKVVEVLTIAKAVGDKGNALFEAIGVAKGKDAPATDGEEAAGKLEEAIEAIQKAKPSLTREQAYAEALEANPSLYNEISKRHPALAE